MPTPDESNAPQIPSNLGGMPDPVTGEYDSNDTEEDQLETSEENTDTGETQIPNKDDETLEAEKREASNAMLEGWKGDRERLSSIEKENQEYREKLARYEEKDEDFLDLSEDERVNKMVERREADKKAKDDREKAETDSEIRWHRSKDPYFKDNEKRILKNAVAFNSSSLTDAIKITKQQDALTAKAEGTKNYHDSRKKQADGVGGSKAGGKITSGYDKKTDGNKSISQLYEEGGV